MVIVVQARKNAGVTDDVKVTVITNNEQITMTTEDEQITMTTDNDETVTTNNGNNGQVTMTGVSDDNSSDDSSDDVEMKQLLSEEKTTTNTGHRSRVRQILTRLPWLVVAIMVLLVGVVLSQYHLHPSYQPSCSNDTEPAINVTNNM